MMALIDGVGASPAYSIAKNAYLFTVLAMEQLTGHQPERSLG
jgi:hypothetical protein